MTWEVEFIDLLAPNE